MNFLKKYLTFHICAVFGFIFIMLIACSIHSPEDFKLFLSVTTTPNSWMYIIYTYISAVFWIFFLSFFTLELIIHKLAKKFFNKDLSINIKNKLYNILFFVGLFILAITVILPGTLVGLLILLGIFLSKFY